jgi:sulfotransferase famil protein
MSANPTRLMKDTYHKIVPFLWKERLDLFLHGESQMFRPCFTPTKSIFIHIPKAAGISVSTAIYGRSVGHYRALHFKEISARHYAKYFTFAITRNPWDRLISAYFFVKQNGTRDVKPIHNDIYSSKYFDSFGTFVRDWLVHQNLFELDCVFWPQFHYVCDDDINCIVDYIGRLESIEESLEHIEMAIGKKINLPVKNKSSRKSQYTEYYDEELVEIVSNLYATDIDMFSYEYGC